jgi:biotin transport system substrate-specific component
MDITYPNYANSDTLIGATLAPIDKARSVGLVIVFSLLMALAAQIRIQIGPIPITAQTFVVLLTGALLGSRLGAASMIVYLVEGSLGLPFFSGGMSGLAHLLGPTGGYLVAFPAAAFITGAFAEHGWDRRFLGSVAAMFIGSLVILLAGWSWFGLVTNSSLVTAFDIAVKPFLIGEVIKVVLAASLLPLGWSLLNSKRK